jgi:putative PIN family toxin of toxin-antitoxin system
VASNADGLKPRVVLDTNVLVSALLSPFGAPAKVGNMAVSRQLVPCYDGRILSEYHQVLARPRFRLDPAKVRRILDAITDNGMAFSSKPLHIPLPDPDDACFAEISEAANAVLITGNLRHYPDFPRAMSVQDFLSQMNSDR